MCYQVISEQLPILMEILPRRKEVDNLVLSHHLNLAKVGNELSAQLTLQERHTSGRIH